MMDICVSFSKFHSIQDKSFKKNKMKRKKEILHQQLISGLSLVCLLLENNLAHLSTQASFDFESSSGIKQNLVV